MMQIWIKKFVNIPVIQISFLYIGFCHFLIHYPTIHNPLMHDSNTDYSKKCLNYADKIL